MRMSRWMMGGDGSGEDVRMGDDDSWVSYLMRKGLIGTARLWKMTDDALWALERQCFAVKSAWVLALVRK